MGTQFPTSSIFPKLSNDNRVHVAAMSQKSVALSTRLAQDYQYPTTQVANDAVSATSSGW
jgi:hypothetical protein